MRWIERNRADQTTLEVQQKVRRSFTMYDLPVDMVQSDFLIVLTSPWSLSQEIIKKLDPKLLETVAVPLATPRPTL